MLHQMIILLECESWNGTNWTEVNDVNSARWGGAAGGTDNTNSLFFGGATPAPQPAGQAASTLTEEWNGASWSEVADLNTGRWALGGAGASNTNCIAFSGYDGTTPTSATEEWNVPSNVIKTLTD